MFINDAVARGMAPCCFAYGFWIKRKFLSSINKGYGVRSRLGFVDIKEKE